jgi:heme/copper-type cytochrome/quinol oxidase subunit 3
LAVLGWSVMGYLTPRRNSAVTVVAMYWYFVVVAWIAVFVSLYLLPWISTH